MKNVASGLMIVTIVLMALIAEATGATINLLRRDLAIPPLRCSDELPTARSGDPARALEATTRGGGGCNLH